MTSGFSGFPVAALDFYDDLEVDNTRSFWEQHRAVYEESVRRRCRRPPRRWPRSSARPRSSGRTATCGSPRTRRRSRPTRAPSWRAGPSTGFYVEVSPRGVRTGAGFYRAEPPQLAAFRAAVDHDLTGAQLEEIVYEESVRAPMVALSEALGKEFGDGQDLPARTATCGSPRTRRRTRPTRAPFVRGRPDATGWYVERLTPRGPHRQPASTRPSRARLGRRSAPAIAHETSPAPQLEEIVRGLERRAGTSPATAQDVAARLRRGAPAHRPAAAPVAVRRPLARLRAGDPLPRAAGPGAGGLADAAPAGRLAGRELPARAEGLTGRARSRPAQCGCQASSSAVREVTASGSSPLGELLRSRPARRRRAASGARRSTRAGAPRRSSL